MASRNKAGFSIIMLVLAVMAAGGYYYFAMSGGRVKAQVQTIATATLGAPVTIDKMSVDRGTGTYIADGVKIANPPGFKNAHALTIRQMRIVTKPAAPGLVGIAEVNVTGAEIFLEVQPQATNLSTLRRNVNRAASVAVVAAPSQPWKTVASRVEMADARLYPAATLTPAATQVVTLPDIVMRGIGEKEQGVILSEALGQVFEHIVRVASQAAGQAGFFAGMSPEALRAMQEQLGLTRGILETAVGIVREDINELATGIKKLIQPQQQAQPPQPQPAPAAP
jgi:hypothetical protein